MAWACANYAEIRSRRLCRRAIAASVFSLAILALVSQLVRAEEEPGNHPLLGTWSARSLSNPAVPIVITVAAGGRATEAVGDYHGTGTWRADGGGIRIAWVGGWSNLLRPTSRDAFELLTWKKGTLPNGPPDDIQPAVRISKPAGLSSP